MAKKKELNLETGIEEEVVEQDPEAEQEIIEPIYSGEQTFRSDCFKLEVAPRLYDTSWNGIPEYTELEHCHFFHTYDSKGRTQENCVSTGQHFHKMKVTPGKRGVPKVECVSGPLCWSKVKERGKWKRVAVPSNPDDTHRHEVTYLRSHKVLMRKANAIAANMIATIENKTQPISGVVG